MANDLPPGALWFETQLVRAADQAVSDLTLDPTDDGGCTAVLRIDGRRRVIDRCPADDRAAALARAKALARLPAYIIDQPQDGSFDGAPWGIPGLVRLHCPRPCRAH